MHKQAARRRSGASRGPGACGENTGDIRDGEITAAYVEHGADEITNHVVQEAVAAHAIDDELATLMPMVLPLRRKDGADG